MHNQDSHIMSLIRDSLRYTHRLSRGCCRNTFSTAQNQDSTTLLGGPICTSIYERLLLQSQIGAAAS